MLWAKNCNYLVCFMREPDLWQIALVMLHYIFLNKCTFINTRIWGQFWPWIFLWAHVVYTLLVTWGKCQYWQHPLTNQITGKSVPTNGRSVFQYCFHSSEFPWLVTTFHKHVNHVCCWFSVCFLEANVSPGVLTCNTQKI